MDQKGIKEASVDSIKYEMGRRIMAYANDYEDIQFMLSLDPEKYTEEQQEELCQWIMRSIVAFRGLVKNHEKIAEIARVTAVGVPRELMKSIRGLEQRVREALGYALALVLGYQSYEEGLENVSPYTQDVQFENKDNDLPRGYYIPLPKSPWEE